MNVPIILLVGQAGSGKDTVADILVKNHGAVKLALADPMKRFAKKVFNFTDEQLWGSSESRNIVDEKSIVDPSNYWKEARDRFIDQRHGFLLEIQALHGAELLLEWFYLVKKMATESVAAWSDGTQVTNGLSPRVALQTLGTEFGRALDKNLWVNFTNRAAQNLLSGGYGYAREQGVFYFDGKSPNIVVISDGRFRNEILGVKQAGGQVFRIFDPKEGVKDVGVKGHASEEEQKEIPRFWFDVIVENEKSHGVESLERAIFNLIESTKITSSTWYQERDRCHVSST